MKKFLCDHCGKEINDSDDYIDYEIEFEADMFPCDLCSKCKETIISDVIKTIDAFICKKR